MAEEKIRSEIVDTQNSKIKSARIVIEAPPEKIFAILSNPRRHKDFDGSQTITENISGPEELILGSKFGMKMHLGINYRILNTVVEYKKNELIPPSPSPQMSPSNQLILLVFNDCIQNPVIDAQVHFHSKFRSKK